MRLLQGLRHFALNNANLTPKLDLQNPHKGGRRESNLQSCLLTSAYALTVHTMEKVTLSVHILLETQGAGKHSLFVCSSSTHIEVNMRLHSLWSQLHRSLKWKYCLSPEAVRQTTRPRENQFLSKRAVLGALCQVGNGKFLMGLESHVFCSVEPSVRMEILEWDFSLIFVIGLEVR